MVYSGPASQLDFAFGPTALLSVDELYERASVELFQSVEEDRRIERKPAGTHAEVLGSVYVPMWANTPDGGLIIVGMEDNGRVSGCAHLTADQLNQLERAGHAYCPDARYTTKRIPAWRPTE
jgi:ATP-dependent DNA helicase RecG